MFRYLNSILFPKCPSKYSYCSTPVGIFTFNPYCETPPSVFISPMESSSKSTIEIVKIFWQSIDTVCVEILASEHDKFLSVISHSPHVISYALANNVKKTKYDEKFPWINKRGSLYDLTRIAKSDPEAWTNIIMDNKDNIINFIDEYILELDLIKSKINSDNPNDLFTYLKNSKPKN